MIECKPLVLGFKEPQELQHSALKKNRIITLEGMPGAGKTVVLSAIAEDFEGDCILLSEMNLEPYSAETRFPVEEQKDIFHHLWVERMNLLKEYMHLGLCFLLDRSYLSNLAFLYALDYIHETSYYPLYKKIFEKDFSDSTLDLVFILDISPETALKRRQLRGDKIPWPWSNLIFLKKIREFYNTELPKNFQQTIKYISTDKEKVVLIKDIKLELKKLIKKECNVLQSYPIVENDQIKTLFDFAANNKLGKITTRFINVLGVPTLYFLKHSIQLEKRQPVFFNNAQLHNILHKYHLLKKVIN